MKENSYIVIQSWMRTELNLSGNELLVYATIYGFSQDGESKFTGSRQYLADWCGCTVRNVQIILNNLTTVGLLSKYEQVINNQKVCSYSANILTGEKISRASEIIARASEIIAQAPGEKTSRAGEKISLNNIIDTISNNKDSNIINNTGDTQESEYESHMYSHEHKNVRPTRNKSGKSVYQKCDAEITAFTTNPMIQNYLRDYLKLRLEIKDKPLYYNSWKGMLNKLLELSDDIDEQAKIIQKSIERGWASFFPLESDFRKGGNKFSEYGEVISRPNTEARDMSRAF